MAGRRSRRRSTVRDLLEHASGLPAQARRSAADEPARVRARHLHDAARVRTACDDRSTAISASSSSDFSRPIADVRRSTSSSTRRRSRPLRAARGLAAALAFRLLGQRSSGSHSRRPSRSTKTSAADDCSSARCTTTTPRRSAASPDTRACSARQAASARSRASILRCGARHVGREAPRSRPRSWQLADRGRARVAGQLARARLGHDAAHLVLRHAHVSRGLRPRRVHRHVALDRSGHAIATSCC